MTLNEWGLYKQSDYDKADKKTGQAPDTPAVASRTEADVYDKLGMDFIEPELREDRGEVEMALSKSLPKLVELSDLRGDLHMHTVASDGIDSIEAMVEASIARGYEFICITDHSKSQTIANGLSAERLLQHVKEIRKVAERYKKQITVWAGSEVDILADGHLDYDDAVLAELDFVVASPHVALKQETDKATSRILRAIDNRYVNLIGHPTGRLIDQRPGLSLDFERVYKAARETGTALEVNSGYPRLDLNDVQARGASSKGVMLSINTDAHAASALGTIVFGLNVARRAGLTKRNVINCLSVRELAKFIARKR
jgi:DNA polymerase (family 10)